MRDDKKTSRAEVVEIRDAPPARLMELLDDKIDTLEDSLNIKKGHEQEAVKKLTAAATTIDDLLLHRPKVTPAAPPAGGPLSFFTGLKQRILDW